MWPDADKWPQQCRSCGEEPGAQRVPGEPGGIEAGGGGAALEGADEAVVAEGGGADAAAFADRAEQGTVADRRRSEPGLQRFDRAQMGARGMAISWPSPAWSVLERRITTRSPSGTSSRSATPGPTPPSGGGRRRSRPRAAPSHAGR